MRLSSAAQELLLRVCQTGGAVVPRLTGAPFELMAERLITQPEFDSFHPKRGYRIVVTEFGRGFATRLIKQGAV